MNISQISVFLENRVGQLADVTGILASESIDMRAINIAESSDYGVLRMITNDAQRTLDILKENGYIVSQSPVLAVGVPDHPGGLAELLGILNKGSISVEYMYSIFGQPNGLAYMIFRVPDIDAARELLISNRIRIAELEELGIC